MTLPVHPARAGEPGGYVASADALDVSLTDYLAVLRRQIVVVLLLVVVTGAAGAALLATRPLTYEAATTVLIQPLTPDPLGGLGASDRLVDLDTERQLVTSTTVLSPVVEQGLGPDVTELRSTLEVETTDATQVLRVVATATEPVAAAELADAVAESYLEQRAGRASRAVERSLTAAQERVALLQAEVAELSAAVVQLDAERDELDEQDAVLEAELTDAQSRRSVAQAQLAAATATLSEVASLQLDPGTIVSPAVAPTDPVGPARPLLLVLVVAVGLLFGIVVAFVRERIDGKVHDPAHVEALLDVPIVASVSVAGGRSGDHEGDDFRRLAVALGALRPEEDFGFALALSAAEPFRGREQLTVDTARALAQDGVSVLLLDAAGGQEAVTGGAATGPAAKGLLNFAVAPDQQGWVEHLIPLEPSVRLLPYGQLPADHPRPAGSLLRVAIERLSELAPTVLPQGTATPITLLHTAAVNASAESLEFQRWVHGTVLFVRLGRTRVSDLRQARRDMTLAGARILGVVLVRGTSRPLRRSKSDGNGATPPDVGGSPPGDLSSPGVARPKTWTG